MREHLELAIDQQRQRGCLNAPRRPGRLLLATREPLRERARRVHADQPVGVGAALGRRRQPLQLLARTQRPEAVADRVRRHRLEPQAPDGLVRAQVLDDLPEDQLAFAPGIARVHERVDIFPSVQLLDRPDAVALALLRLDLERAVRKDGKDVEGPRLVLRRRPPRAPAARRGGRPRRSRRTRRSPSSHPPPSNPPRTLTMSWATLGFSVMTSAFPTLPPPDLGAATVSPAHPF